MATAELLNNPVSTPAVNGSVLPPPDKYRGAVVEVTRSKGALHVSAHLADLSSFFSFKLQDLQLPPAFSLPGSELIAHAIELAYDRDFSHIPYVSGPVHA